MKSRALRSVGREVIQQIREHVDFACKRSLHDLQFAPIDEFAGVDFAAENLCVEGGEFGFILRLDEDVICQVEKFVPGCSAHGPFAGKGFARLQDFFDDRVKRPMALRPVIAAQRVEDFQLNAVWLREGSFAAAPEHWLAT